MLRKNVVNEEEDNLKEVKIGKLRISVEDYNQLQTPRRTSSTDEDEDEDEDEELQPPLDSDSRNNHQFNLIQFTKLNQNLNILNHHSSLILKSNNTQHHQYHHHHQPNQSINSPSDSKLDLTFKDFNTSNLNNSRIINHESERNSNLIVTGEVDECDKLNPLVLHHAKIQLQTSTPSIQPIPLILKSKLKKGYKFKVNSSRSCLNLDFNNGFDEQVHDDDFNHSLILFNNFIKNITRQPITSMCLESVNAIISTQSNTNLQTNLQTTLTQLQSTQHLSPKPPSLGTHLSPFNFQAYKTFCQTIKSFKPLDLHPTFAKNPPLKLRDVVSRITFTFNEFQSCELNCRKVMVLISKSYQTLPPGSMCPIKIGQIKVSPPLPSIRHETCCLSMKPSIDLEWTDGTWEAFDPTDLSSDQILDRCHFHSMAD